MSGVRVSAQALDFALAHVERYGDTDIVPPAFEYQAIRHSWNQVRDYLCKQDLDTWQVRSTRQFLSPKKKLGFRIATQLDPFDTLFLTALVYEAGSFIEANRSPSFLEVVHSHRFEPNDEGRLYSSTFSHETFRQESLRLAADPSHEWVVLTDIADFYPRLYTHRLDNALMQWIPRDHARVIIKLIKKWNSNVSYGIPVGPAATNLLAEIAIADVDQALQGEGIGYCRYSDDFRLFANSRPDALRHLSFLANILFNNHGLTLQEAKTEIVSADKFINQFRETDDQRTRRNLKSNVFDIMERLGHDIYFNVDYDELHPDEQAKVDELNLLDIVKEQITRDEPINASLTGFALRRLAQIGGVSPELASLMVSQIEELTVVFKDVITALSSVTHINRLQRHRLMLSVRELLDNPYLSHLDYYRVWILRLFQQPNNATIGKWQQRYGQYADPLTRRALILAMGAANNSSWIRSRKHGLPVGSGNTKEAASGR